MMAFKCALHNVEAERNVRLEDGTRPTTSQTKCTSLASRVHPDSHRMDIPTALYLGRLISHLETGGGAGVLPRELKLTLKIPASSSEGIDLGALWHDASNNASFLVFKGERNPSQWEADLRSLHQVPGVKPFPEDEHVGPTQPLNNNLSTCPANVLDEVEGWLSSPSIIIDTASAKEEDHPQPNSETGLWVHQSMLEVFLSFRAKIVSTLRLLRPRTLYVTGHGMGAGLATLTALEACALQPQLMDIRLFCFGSPRVGSPAFIRKLENQVSLREWFHVCNESDCMCQLPFAVVPNFDSPHHPICFAHGGRVMMFRENTGGLQQNHDLSVYLRNLRGQSSQGQWVAGDRKNLFVQVD